jgi:hypothetical protein
MSTNRIISSGSLRRGLLAGAATILAAGAILTGGGCGGGNSSTVESEKAADAELLNAALAREQTAVDGLTHGLPLLRGTRLAVAREFRAQDQEHVDALTKAIRGVGGETDGEASTLDFTGVKSEADFVAFIYELENSTVASHMSAIPELSLGSSNVLMASIVANEAQQLSMLRQALGARPLELVPEALENGETPAPGEEAPEG